MNEHEIARIAAAMHAETWLPIPGYEATYEVSDLGRVRSIPRPCTKGGILAATIDSRGYPRVGLVQDGRQRTRRVHVLVMRAFVGEPPLGMEVRHLNGDSTDARLVNLAYGTHAENVADTVAHGRNPSSRKTHCPQGHPYDEQNTMVSLGRRKCRTCNAFRSSRGRRAS